MYYDELSEEAVFLQNMIADSIEQQSEYMDMQKQTSWKYEILCAK